jgi:hypothetical protein
VEIHKATITEELKVSRRRQSYDYKDRLSDDDDNCVKNIALSNLAMMESISCSYSIKYQMACCDDIAKKSDCDVTTRNSDAKRRNLAIA